MELVVLAQKLVAIGKAEGGEMFFDKPDRWYESPKWRCVNDHVTTHYLKSKEKGGACCLARACGEFVLLTFPEDEDGPLKEKRDDGDRNSRDESVPGSP